MGGVVPVKEVRATGMLGPTKRPLRPCRWVIGGLAAVGCVLAVLPWCGWAAAESMRAPEFMVPCVFVTVSLLLCSLPSAVNFLYRREVQFEELIDRKQPTHHQKVWLLRLHRLCMLASGGLLAAGLVWYRVYCYPTSLLDPIERASVMTTMVLAWIAYQAHLSALLKHLLAAFLHCRRPKLQDPFTGTKADVPPAKSAMRRVQSIPRMASSIAIHQHLTHNVELQSFVVALHQDKKAADTLDAFALGELL
jgi:hypothetical protein